MTDIKVTREDIQEAETDLSKVRDKMGSLEHLGAKKIERMRQSRIKKAARKRLKKASDIDKTMDEVIAFYVAGEFDKGAEGAKEIAQLWKAAGLQKQAYLDLMEYIESEAVKQTGYESTRVHIKSALEKTANKKIIISQ